MYYERGKFTNSRKLFTFETATTGNVYFFTGDVYEIPWIFELWRLSAIVRVFSEKQGDKSSVGER